MSNMIKNLIKSLAILSVFLTTPFIGIEPSQAYTEDGQPTTIEECREKKQEAKDSYYAEHVYENCMKTIQSSHNIRCCELKKNLGNMSNVPVYADICLDSNSKPNFSCEEDTPSQTQPSLSKEEHCLEIAENSSTGHFSGEESTWYKENCLNSDNTLKYGSQSNEQSNNPEDSSNEVQSETIIVPAEELNNLPMPEETENPESETPSQDTPTSSPTEHCRYFLGMVSWDCNVSLLNQDKNISQDDLGSSIWTIAANIATDITVIAAYLVVGYIIYGGYLYIFSAGDTNKTITGKKAIHQALLGLAIVLSANIILNGIRIGLVGGGFSNCVTNECIDSTAMVKNALDWVIGISGAVSAIFIVYGGTSYTMSRGDANKVQTAKQIITYALIGMIIVTLAELIVIFASNIINSANNTAYLDTNQISIIKEYHET